MMITGKCYITSRVDGPTNNLQDKLHTTSSKYQEY